MPQVKCIKDGAEIMRPVQSGSAAGWPFLYEGETAEYDPTTKMWTIESDIKRGVQY